MGEENVKAGQMVPISCVGSRPARNVAQKTCASTAPVFLPSLWAFIHLSKTRPSKTKAEDGLSTAKHPVARSHSRNGR